MMYLFWVIVGIVAGAVCAICDEGPKMSSDRRTLINFTSIIISYLVGTTLFGGAEPEGGVWLLQLILQIASTEISFRLLKPYLRVLY